MRSLLALLLCPHVCSIALHPARTVLPSFSTPPSLRFPRHAPLASTASPSPASIVPAPSLAADEPESPPSLASRLLSSASTISSLAAIIAVDISLRKFFVARAIPFPSSLAGMLLLFSSLCGLQAIAPKAAAAVFSAASPGCALISKWLAILCATPHSVHPRKPLIP